MKKDIKLISYSKEKGIIDIDWTDSWGTITGRDRLIQDIVKRILTLKGSNYFDSDFGENFFRIFGVINRDHVDQVKEVFPVLVDSLEESIKSEQLGDTSLEDKEKLLELNLKDVEFDEEFSS